MKKIKTPIMYLRYVTYTLALRIMQWVGNCFKAAEHRSERARKIKRDYLDSKPSGVVFFRANSSYIRLVYHSK